MSISGATISGETISGLPGAFVAPVLPPIGPVSEKLNTTLSIPAKAFTRKHYSDALDEIRAKGLLVAKLSEKDRSGLEYENAKAELAALENALMDNVNITKWGNIAKAKERLEIARTNRDHYYYMDVVNKAWAEFNKSKKK